MASKIIMTKDDRAKHRKEAEDTVDKHVDILRPLMAAFRDEMKGLGYCLTVQSIGDEFEWCADLIPKTK